MALTLPGLGGSGDLELPLPDDAAPLAAEARSAEVFGAPLISRTQVVVSRPGGLSGAEQAALGRLRPRREPAPGARPRGDRRRRAPHQRRRRRAGRAAGGPASVITYLAFARPRSIARQAHLGARLHRRGADPRRRDRRPHRLVGRPAGADRRRSTTGCRWWSAITLALIAPGRGGRVPLGRRAAGRARHRRGRLRGRPPRHRRRRRRDRDRREPGHRAGGLGAPHRHRHRLRDLLPVRRCASRLRERRRAAARRSARAPT